MFLQKSTAVPDIDTLGNTENREHLHTFIGQLLELNKFNEDTCTKIICNDMLRTLEPRVMFLTEIPNTPPFVCVVNVNKKNEWTFLNFEKNICQDNKIEIKCSHKFQKPNDNFSVFVDSDDILADEKKLKILQDKLAEKIRQKTQGKYYFVQYNHDVKLVLNDIRYNTHGSDWTKAIAKLWHTTPEKLYELLQRKRGFISDVLGLLQQREIFVQLDAIYSTYNEKKLSAWKTFNDPKSRQNSNVDDMHKVAQEIEGLIKNVAGVGGAGVGGSARPVTGAHVGGAGGGGTATAGGGLRAGGGVAGTGAAGRGVPSKLQRRMGGAAGGGTAAAGGGLRAGGGVAGAGAAGGGSARPVTGAHVGGAGGGGHPQAPSKWNYCTPPFLRHHLNTEANTPWNNYGISTQSSPKHKFSFVPFSQWIYGEEIYYFMGAIDLNKISVLHDNEYKTLEFNQVKDGKNYIKVVYKFEEEFYSLVDFDTYLRWVADPYYNPMQDFGYWFSRPVHGVGIKNIVPHNTGINSWQCQLDDGSMLVVKRFEVTPTETCKTPIKQTIVTRYIEHSKEYITRDKFGLESIPYVHGVAFYTMYMKMDIHLQIKRFKENFMFTDFCCGIRNNSIMTIVPDSTIENYYIRSKCKAAWNDNMIYNMQPVVGVANFQLHEARKDHYFMLYPEADKYILNPYISEEASNTYAEYINQNGLQIAEKINGTYNEIDKLFHGTTLSSILNIMAKMKTKDGFNSGGLVVPHNADMKNGAVFGSGIYLTPNKKLAEMYATKNEKDPGLVLLCNVKVRKRLMYNMKLFNRFNALSNQDYKMFLQQWSYQNVPKFTQKYSVSWVGDYNDSSFIKAELVCKYSEDVQITGIRPLDPETFLELMRQHSIVVQETAPGVYMPVVHDSTSLDNFKIHFV